MGRRFEGKDAVQDHSGWHCTTHEKIAPDHRFPIEGPSGRPEGKATFVPWPNGVYVTVGRGTNPTVTVTIIRGKTRPGRVQFTAGEVALGRPNRPSTIRSASNGCRRRACCGRRAARAAGPVQDDYPAFWVRYKTGKHYLAWVAYQKEKDRVLLAERDGPDGNWSEPVEVAGPGDHFRVALAEHARRHALGRLVQPARAQLGPVRPAVQGRQARRRGAPDRRRRGRTSGTA